MNAARNITGIHKNFGFGHCIHVVVKLPSIANKLKVKKHVTAVNTSSGIIKFPEYGLISRSKKKCVKICLSNLVSYYIISRIMR